MEKNTQFSESEVRPCAKALCIILQNAPSSNLKACRRKFSKTKFNEVAKIKISSSANWYDQITKGLKFFFIHLFN